MGKKVKFTEEQVAEIVRLYVEEKIPVRRIGEIFKHDKSAIKKALNDKNIKVSNSRIKIMPNNIQFKGNLTFIWYLLVSVIAGALSGVIGAALVFSWLSFDSVSAPSNQLFRLGPGKAQLVQSKDESQLTVDVVKHVSPAVVSIIVSKDVSKLYNQTGALSPFEEFFRKNKEWIFALLAIAVIVIVYFLFYVPKGNDFRMFLETLNTNIVAGLLTAVIVGIYLHKLESSRRTGDRRLQQRLELRKRALECFEEINKLIVKIRFYKTSESYDYKDIRISFDQMANFFIELQEIYKKIPGAIPSVSALDKLDRFYQGWNKYFSFEELPKNMSLKQKERIKDALLEKEETILKIQVEPSSIDLIKQGKM